MAKPTITTRAAKGSALTWTEGDTNLTNLRDATITIKAGSAGTDVVSDLNGTVTLVAGTNVTLSGDNTAKTVTIDATGGSGITDIIQDTTPQLGGDLDVNSYKITATASNDVNIEVTGSGGHINLKHGDPSSATAGVVVGNGTNSGFIHSNGATTLGLAADIANASGPTYMEINADGNIYLNPRASTGKTFLGPSGTNTTLTTLGTTDLILNTNNGTTSGSITIADGANQNITIAANGTGATVVTGAFIGAQTSAANLNSPITGRNIVTTAGTTLRPSILVQKARSDITLASMTNEPAVISFGVRDSALAARTFATMRSTYVGTGTNPSFNFDVSTDNYTSTVQCLTFGAGTATWGTSGGNYTFTTVGTSDLTINTNAGTNSGVIKIFDGANADINIQPNGTGSVVFRNGTNTGNIDIGNKSITNGNDSGVTVNSGSGALILTRGSSTAAMITTPDATQNLRLRTNGFTGGYIEIQAATNGNIDFTPNGSGAVRFFSQLQVGSGTSAGQIFSSGTQDLELRTGGANLSQITLGGSAANGNIDITPNGTGNVNLNADTVQIGDSNANATITTNGTGDLILNTNSGTSSGSITINDGGGGWISITPEGTGRTVIKNLNYYENVYAYGNSGTLSWAPDVAGVNASNIVTMTLTGNLTFNGFTNPISGQTLTVVLTQDATGGRTLTSTMKFAGGSKTLSTAANAIDILTVSYIGTTYYASLSKGYA